MRVTRLETRGRISTDSLAFAVPSASISSTSGRNSIRSVTTFAAPPQPPAGRSCGSSLQATTSARAATITVVVVNLRIVVGAGCASMPELGKDPLVYSLPTGNCYWQQFVTVHALDTGSRPGSPRHNLLAPGPSNRLVIEKKGKLADSPAVRTLTAN